jgi:outer membrane protein
LEDGQAGNILTIKHIHIQPRERGPVDEDLQGVPVPHVTIRGGGHLDVLHPGLDAKHPVFNPETKGRIRAGAQREAIAGEKLRVRYQKGFFWPTLDLSGNYYTRRPSLYEGVDWDVMFLAHVPLFQGGQVKAGVDEALSKYKQARFGLDMLLRQALRDVRKIHNELSTTVDEAASLKEAYETSQKSYDFQLREYRLGLVTNLEVIEALNTLQDQKEAFDDARLAAKELLIRLKIETEVLPGAASAPSERNNQP